MAVVATCRMKSRYWRIGRRRGRRAAAAWDRRGRRGQCRRRISVSRHNAVAAACFDAALREEAMHRPSQFDLLAERRFAPFFWTQFLGAGNDNVSERTGDLRRVPRRDADVARHERARRIWRAPCSSRLRAVSASAGQLADKLEKSRLIPLDQAVRDRDHGDRLARLLAPGSPAPLHRAGAHRRALDLFGPVKYAILPQTLKPEELIGGNGLVEMGDRSSPSCIGTIVGGLVVASMGRGRSLAVRVAVAIAFAGYVAEPKIPLLPIRGPGLAINWNPVPELEEPAGIAHGRTTSSGCRCSASPGSGSMARSFSPSSPASRATRWAATSTSSRFCSRCSRSASASGRCSASGFGTSRRARPVPFGSIGSRVRRRPVARELATCTRAALADFDVFLASAHTRVRRRPRPDRPFGGFFIVPLYALIQDGRRRRTARGSSPRTTS